MFQKNSKSTYQCILSIIIKTFPEDWIIVQFVRFAQILSGQTGRVNGKSDKLNWKKKQIELIPVLIHL